MQREMSFFTATVVAPALLVACAGAYLMYSMHRQMLFDAGPPPPHIEDDEGPPSFHDEGMPWDDLFGLPETDTTPSHRRPPPDLGRGGPGGARAVRGRRIVFWGTGAVLVLAVGVFVASGLASLLRRRKEQKIEGLKTDFLDNVSHELKTPLAGIRISAELLAEGRIPDEARRKKTLDAIISETDRLSRMVAMLLDFGRLEKGNMHFNIEDFDLAPFAASLADDPMLAATAGPRLKFVPAPDAKPSHVRADRDAVRRILVSLVENAVKYSSDEIDVVAAGSQISVMDRGEGIPSGDEERVFERFYRADNSLTRRVGGSGLGLAIARALARGMGGKLDYSHRDGGGSVFTLSLKEAV